MKFLIPDRIPTERLILRIFKEEDWKDLYELYGDPEVVKYTIFTPFTEYETWQKIASFTGHWSFRGYGPYALEEKQSGKVVGFAGPYFPPQWPDPEIQWSLSKNFWGRGYASEAVLRIKNILNESMPDTSFMSLIHPDNIASKKLAEKMNAVFEKEWYFKKVNWQVFRHLPLDK